MFTGVLMPSPPAIGSDGWRRNMSASKVASAVGMVGAFDSPLGLWSKMTGREPGTDIDPALALYGKYLEPALLQWVKDTHEGTLVGETTYHHKDNERYTATPDGQLVTHDEIILIECKTARNSWEWGEPGTAEIPPKYLIQTAWQMYVTGARRVLVPVNKDMAFSLYSVEWSDVAQDMPLVLERIEQFMWYVDNDMPPDFDGADQTYRAVRHWHPEILDESVEVGNDVAQELKAIAEQKKELKQRENLAKSRLLAAMGTARRATTPDGSPVATRQSRKGAAPSLVLARNL